MTAVVALSVYAVIVAGLLWSNHRLRLLNRPTAPARSRHFTDLLADQPAEVLAGEALDRRFYEVVDQETRWFA
jgi:hypothetical protein